MIVSSLSFNLPVKAIIISLCLRRSCLYLSTYYLSSSIYILSFSISCIFSSYSFLITLYLSSNAFLNWGVSSTFCPPISIYEFIAYIFASSNFFYSFSCRNSLDLCSNAHIAAFLSSSALFFSFSNRKTCSVLLIWLFLWSNSYFNLLNSISYLRTKVL